MTAKLSVDWYVQECKCPRCGYRWDADRRKSRDSRCCPECQNAFGEFDHDIKKISMSEFFLIFKDKLRDVCKIRLDESSPGNQILRMLAEIDPSIREELELHDATVLKQVEEVSDFTLLQQKAGHLEMEDIWVLLSTFVEWPYGYNPNAVLQDEQNLLNEQIAERN